MIKSQTSKKKGHKYINLGDKKSQNSENMSQTCEKKVAKSQKLVKKRQTSEKKVTKSYKSAKKRHKLGGKSQKK